MKHIFVTIISISLFVSCGKEKKTTPSKKAPVETVKEAEPIANNPSVVVDADGIANILVTTNDIMKFNVKKLIVKSGQKVKLTLKHTGKLDKRAMGHNVVILKQDVKISDFASKAAAAKDNNYIPKGTTEVIAHTKIIGGGEETTIEFTAPKAGIYDFICSFPGHFAIMKGKFVVE